MKSRFGGIVAVHVAVAALVLTGCAAPIPQEPVPDGWALDVHQPGEWWTQPVIPRSVVVQRCPVPAGWSSEPDLSKVTAVRPGISVEYGHWADEYQCPIGWSHPVGEPPLTSDLGTEKGLRHFCSSSGLPMDAGWRFLGHRELELLGNPPLQPENLAETGATAAFIDRNGTVVGCVAQIQNGAWAGATMELSLGGDRPAGVGVPDCPVAAQILGRADDGTVDEFRLRGAGAVRGSDGRLLKKAATLRIGLAGDSVTASHPVVEGIAIVNAWIRPKAAIALDWDKPPPAVAGSIFSADGKLLGTCGG